jgi:hypothetical protein
MAWRTSSASSGWGFQSPAAPSRARSDDMKQRSAGADDGQVPQAKRRTPAGADGSSRRTPVGCAGVIHPRQR